MDGVSDVLDHRGMEPQEKNFSFTNDEVRRVRLEQLSTLKGGLAAIAEKAGCSAANLDHIIKRRRQGKARANGEKPPAMLGDRLARDIEKGFGLAPGWMDWPFPEVDFEAVARLTPSQLGILKGRIIEAVKDLSLVSV